MALDTTDWTVSIGGDIRWTGAGTATNVTVLEMHRFLQDLADDAVATATTDDFLDISDETPSDRATDNIITLINGYNIDDTAAQHIFDGSITQTGGDTVYSGLVVVGAVVAGTELQIVQDNVLLTSYWSTGLNEDAAANILLRIMVKTRVEGADIDGQRIRVFARELGDTYAEFSATLGAGNSTAAVFTGTDLNNATAQATIATYDRFTNTEGYQQIDVDALGGAEDYYSQWDIVAGTLPVSASINDLYEYTKWIQRRGTAETIHGMNGDLFRGITGQWGYDAESGGGPATNDEFVWGAYLSHGAVTGGPFVVGEKVTGGTSGAYGRVLSVDGTDLSLVVSTESGTWSNGEVLTGFTSSATATTDALQVGQASGGGEATLLAVDDDGTTGIIWVQLLKGSNPANDAICYENGDHFSVMTVNGSVQSRTLSPAFLGASTGTSIIGAFGIGIATNDLTASDQLFDLTNTLRQPPNNVTFTVSGLISGEDRVLVGPESGGVLNVGQFGLNTSLTTDDITSVVVDAAIPTDTPATGTIRVFDDVGVARRLEYSSYTGSTFTISSTDGNEDFLGTNATAANNVFISYIDELASGTSASFTGVYLSDRALFIRVRDGGASPIKTFETTGTLGNAGGSSTAIRTTDA